MNRVGQRIPRRFAHQKVDMFGHDHVPVNTQGKALAHFLQAPDKQVVRVRGLKLSFSAITTEGEEVGLSGLVKASQTAGHDQTYARAGPSAVISEQRSPG